jgi:predicted TIM-barrel fold metal-dependent hydrolase
LRPCFRKRASGVKVVIDHFAHPDPAAGVECKGFQQALAGVRAADTWIKLSAPYRLGGVDPQRYVDALLDAGGLRQLVWASDWPFVSHEDEITYERCLSWLSEWIPDAGTRNIVFAETPAALFGFAGSNAIAADYPR